MRKAVTYTVEFDREEDGRWIADVPAIPGCLAYGRTRVQALARVRRVANAVVSDFCARGERLPVDYGTARLKLAI